MWREGERGRKERASKGAKFLPLMGVLSSFLTSPSSNMFYSLSGTTVVPPRQIKTSMEDDRIAGCFWVEDVFSAKEFNLDEMRHCLWDKYISRGPVYLTA